ncbi:protein unc-93 A [Biomphalaria glabrata]|nr:protein unc-93 A [Biomphalaria glabrata]
MTSSESPSHEQTAESAGEKALGHQQLQTISENEVTCFEPHSEKQDKYTHITNKILSVDESFLYSSQASLADYQVLGTRKRAHTMQNIHERASFLDLTSELHFSKMLHKALFYIRDDVTFGSTAGLNMPVIDTLTPDLVPLKEDSNLNTVPSLSYAKNLLVVSLSVTLMFIALGSVRNLQSSMNHEAGVGVISMAVSFAGYMLGSVVSASLVQIFQPKFCLVSGLFPQFLYIASNLYPAMWLMVPVSLAQGFALAILWNAMSTYVVLLARGKALLQDIHFSVVSSRYFGFFGLFFQSYFVIGNLISSLVLSQSGASPADLNNITDLNSNGFDSDNTHSINASIDESHNSSSNRYIKPSHIHLCGATFWQHFDLGGEAYHVEEKTKYLLLGIYLGFVLLSIIIAVLFQEKLNPKLFESALPAVERFKQQLLSLKKFSYDRHFLLLLPMLMYSFMEVGFITAEVTKAYVTCALGIHMVGYTMICFGVCGCLSSYLSGFLNKFTGYRPLMITAVLLNLAVLVHMIVWKPSPNELLPFFVDFGLWGVSDGIFVSQVNSLLSATFPNNYEEAFAGLRIAQGFGVALVFACSGFLSMLAKIYMTGAFAVFSTAAYLFMDLAREREMKRKIALLQETSI